MKRFPRLRHTIVNVRGTNGSGKSYLVHRLIDEFRAIPLGDGKKINAYRLEAPVQPPVYVIGKYESPTGGCDTFKGGAVESEVYIRFLCGKGNVLFEGLIASGIAGRWIRLAESLPQHKWVFLTLNTPLDKCIDRMNERRAARGAEPLADPRNIVLKYKAVNSSFLSMEKAGLDVRLVDYKTAYEQVCELLGLKQIRRFPRLSSNSKDVSAGHRFLQSVGSTEDSTGGMLLH